MRALQPCHQIANAIRVLTWWFYVISKAFEFVYRVVCGLFILDLGFMVYLRLRGEGGGARGTGVELAKN